MSSVPGRVTGLGGWLGPFDHAQQLGKDALCRFVCVDADRGQRHHLELRLGNIVKPDDRNIARDFPPGLVERPKDPHRHLVVGGEDCGDIVTGCELATLFVTRCG